MRFATLPLSVALLVLLASAGLRAEDEPSKREMQERSRLMNETVAIQLLEQRVRALEMWNQALFGLSESYAKTLKVARQGTAGSVSVMQRRIVQLEETLATERKRKGIDENELMQQLAAEQEHHTQDVLLLQKELMNANESAEMNRLEATQSWQRAALIEEEVSRLRKRLAQSLWLFGEMGPAAKAALPWLKRMKELEDQVLTEAANAAANRIEIEKDG